MGPSYLRSTFTLNNYYLVDYNITYIETFYYYIYPWSIVEPLGPFAWKD